MINETLTAIQFLNIFNEDLFLGKHPLSKGVACVISKPARYPIQDRPTTETTLIMKCLKKERRKTLIKI